MAFENTTPEAFDEKVIDAEGTTLVAFFATYCPYCSAFMPLFREFEPGPGLTLREAIVDEDENPLWDRFAVEAVPTIIAFRGGEIIGRRDAARGVGLTQDNLDALLAEIT